MIGFLRWHMRNKRNITTKDIVLIGVMLATIEAVKVSLSAIPGVELVTLLVMLYALVFRRNIYYALAAFILLEGCLYGFGVWWFMYVYIWPLLAFLTQRLAKNNSVIIWSVFAAAYGLMFGALCSIPYLIIGGPKMAFAWWIAGIPTDITHCISNFVVCLILFNPLKIILNKVNEQFYTNKY